MLQMTPQQQIVAKCAAVAKIAADFYGVDLSKVGVRFDLKGGVAGYACRRGGDFHMRFNHDMLTRGDAAVLENMINTVVPHEMAHIVCFMKPSLGRNHDGGWQRVDLALGGTGARTHDMAVVYGKGLTYEYLSTTGHKVRIGDRHQATVLRGGTIRFKRGKGNIQLGCAFSIVGQGGRTLTNPVVKQAVSTVPVQVPAPRPVYVPRAFTPTVLPAFRAAPAVRAPVIPIPAGKTKADMARIAVRKGQEQGLNEEELIQAIMLVTGHPRALSRAYYKNIVK
jgi:predicted SprT family Zn-dependent metalloprotease